MRRFRRPSQELSVSLFPFLAVLICTFGVLIVMLVISVMAADSEAKAESQVNSQEAQDELDRLNAELDLNSVRADGLMRARPRLAKRLQDERDKRAHLENEIAKLEVEAELLASQLMQVDRRDNSPETLEDINAQAEQLKQHLLRAEVELAEKQTIQSTAKPVMYSIVPHQGPGGTNRHPIYIECRKNRLIIQPYGIEIQKGDFAHPISERNPLDAALMAVREYFVQHRLAESQGSPYPLLVVRPDGAESYILARHAMRGWDDEFGYELIAADKPLDFGKPDSQLAQKIRDAVIQGKSLQQRMKASRIASARNRRSSGIDVVSAGGLTVSRTQGGFVTQAGSTSADALSDVRRQTKHLQSGPGRTDVKTDQEMDARSSENTNKQSKAKSEGRNQPGMSPSALADKRGIDWALPSRTPGAVGYLRPIRLSCSRDQISVQLGTAIQTRVITFDGPTVSSVEPLVQQVWGLIDSWGVAGADGYWKPELLFSVAPGGENRYQELKTLLKNSGLKIRKRQ